MARKKNDKNPKLELPPVKPGEPMNAKILQSKLRKERVKQKLLAGKMDFAEVAASEGIAVSTLRNVIGEITREGILEQAKEATKLVYMDYSGEVDWCIEEAREMHLKSKKGLMGEDGAGRLDCLNFVATKKKESVEVAQKLGLLEVVAEKQEHTHHIKVDDAKLIKQFGDFIASKED